MLFVFNFIVAQWFGYRLGRVYLTKTKADVGWAIVGPVVPLTGFGLRPWPNLVALLKGREVNVLSTFNRKELSPMVDWKVRIM